MIIKNKQKKMVDLLNEVRCTAQDALTATQNGENINGLHTVENNEIEPIQAIEDEVNAGDTDNRSSPKQFKLETPAFLKPKPKAIWKTENEIPKRVDKLGIESIFPNICLHFLRDDCVEGENCYDTHELPSNADICQKLDECGTENAAKLFRIIIARNSKLLHQYFQTFVDYFGEHKRKDYLIETICICERQLDEKCRLTFFQQLVRAFIRSGETYTTAMVWIFFNLGNADNNTLDILLNINLIDGINVSDFLSVFRTLNDYRYRFNVHIVNRLIFLCTESKYALDDKILLEFTQLICIILKSNHNSGVHRTLNKDYYKQYLQLMVELKKR